MIVENGKVYQVRNLTTEASSLRTALGTDSKGQHWFESRVRNCAVAYKHVEEIPQPKLIPWTIDTIPLDRPLWIQKSRKKFLVTEVFAAGITAGGTFIAYRELANAYKSLNVDRTLSPCGELE